MIHGTDGKTALVHAVQSGREAGQRAQGSPKKTLNTGKYPPHAFNPRPALFIPQLKCPRASAHRTKSRFTRIWHCPGTRRNIHGREANTRAEKKEFTPTLLPTAVFHAVADLARRAPFWGTHEKEINQRLFQSYGREGGMAACTARDVSMGFAGWDAAANSGQFRAAGRVREAFGTDSVRLYRGFWPRFHGAHCSPGAPAGCAPALPVQGSAMNYRSM